MRKIGFTYAKLLEQLKTLTPKQLKMSVVVHDYATCDTNLVFSLVIGTDENEKEPVLTYATD